MEANAMACEPLVQHSKDDDELLKQTGPNPLVYSNVDSTLWMKLYDPSRPCGQDVCHPIVTVRSPVPACLCVRPSSLHWFHTRITIVATYPARAAMSRYDKLHPGDQPFCSVQMHSLADIAPFRVDEAFLH